MSKIMNVSIVAAVAAVAACSGEDGPLTVTFETGTTAPAVLAVQDGDGPWQALTVTPEAPATVEFAAGYYGYAVACPLFSGDIGTVRVKYDARAGTFRMCGSSAVTTVPIEGVVTPANSQVFLGQFDLFVEADGTFAVETVAGLDLAAVHATSARMMIVRGVDGAAPLTLDLLAGGFDRLRAPITITGTTGGELTVVSELHTAMGYVPMPGDPASAWVVPASERVSGDSMVVLADERDADRFRTIQHVVSGDTVPVLDLAEVPAPTFAADRTQATWTDEPTYLYAEMSAAGLGSLRLSQGATANWQAVSGHTALPWLDVTTLPGWDASWPSFTPGDELSWSVYADFGARDAEFAMVGRRGTLIW